MLAVVVVLFDEGLLSDEGGLDLLVLAVQSDGHLLLGLLQLQSIGVFSDSLVCGVDYSLHLSHVSFSLIVVNLIFLELKLHSPKLLG